LYGAVGSPGQGFWQNQTKNKAANDKELDPCGNSNSPCLRQLVALPYDMATMCGIFDDDDYFYYFRCDDNQQIVVSHFGEHTRLHLESSKQNYYIISLRAIIKAIFNRSSLVTLMEGCRDVFYITIP